MIKAIYEPEHRNGGRTINIRLYTPLSRLLIMLSALLIAYPGCRLVTKREPEIPEYVEEEAQKLVKLVNRYRERNGLHPLQWDSYIHLICVSHNRDMADRDYFSHYSPDYLGPFDRLRQARVEYVYAGENIAHGQTSPEQVLSDWLHSPAHKRNIESVLYTHHAVAYDPEGHYWTHMFINYGMEGPFSVSHFLEYRYVRYRIIN